MSNTDLIKLTETKIGDNTALSTFVEKAKTQTICLFPETVQFTDPALKFGAAIVSVDTKLDQYGNNKDVYKNESGTYCLHLAKLNEISQHAGIQITDSRILERKTDERGRVTFIEHQVRGRVKYVDGSIKEDVATGKYDYFRDVEKYVKRDGSLIEGMIKSRRSHAEALAESNAKTRLYNKLNFKLPSSFTLEELKKPFLVPFVIEDKDELLKDLPKEDQLQIKREVARKRMGLIDNQMYPQQKIVQNSAALPESNNENISDANYTDIPQGESGISSAEQNKIIAEEFRNVEQKERTEKILNLVKINNYTDPNGAPFTAARIEKNSVDTQLKFIEKLLNMSVPETVEDDLV